MQDINFDVLSDPFKFELIVLPCSCYQKKNGEVAYMKEGFIHSLLEKAPTLAHEMAKAVEEMGNCPAILSSIPKSTLPTKFCTFPVSPTSIRAEEPDRYVFSRLKGRFKKNSLLPGWTLLPRSDMVEFSSYKLSELIRYFKLSKVVIQFEAFTLDEDDMKVFERIRKIMEKHLRENIYIAHKPKNDGVGVQSLTSGSTLTMEE